MGSFASKYGLLFLTLVCLIKCTFWTTEKRKKKEKTAQTNKIIFLALKRYYSPMTITTFTETRNKTMKSFILCSNMAVVSQPNKSKTRPIQNTSKLKMLILTLFRFYAKCIILNVQFQVFKNVAAAFEYTQICLNKILICQGKVKLNKQLVFSYVKFRQKLEEFLSLKKYKI